MLRQQVIFNCFDEDGNGVLDREEFKMAATRFSDQKDNIDAFCNRVFAAVCTPVLAMLTVLV